MHYFIIRTVILQKKIRMLMPTIRSGIQKPNNQIYRMVCSLSNAPLQLILVIHL